MSNSPVVPRPARLRSRDLLHQGGPALMCAIAIGGILLLWQKDLLPSNFVGEVQSPASTVNSPEIGRLTDVEVEPFRMVTNGQVLARLAKRSDESIKVELLGMKADLEVLRVRMLQDQERNDLNLAQIRGEIALRQLELAGAKIRLRQAESEFERIRTLHEGNLIATGWGPDREGYEVALRDRDVLSSEVADKEKQIAELQEGLKSARPSATSDRQKSIQDTIEAAIAAQETQLRELEGPMVLRAPINGMVTKVYRLKGENVAAAEPLFEIHGVKPEWILGFIRQPINNPPKVGDSIQVRSRGRPTQQAMAKVLRIGSHLDTFVQTLRVRGFDSSMERGLPVMLSYPDTFTLHPGELVDLIPD